MHVISHDDVGLAQARKPDECFFCTTKIVFGMVSQAQMNGW